MRHRFIWRWLLIGACLAPVFSCGHGEADVTPELRDPDKAVAPIKHQPYFRGERELFGYAPRFVPNAVGFDTDNRPYIRDGGVVQTPDEAGGWTRLAIAPSIAEYFRERGETTTFEITGGEFVDQRVVFDDQGDAYTLVEARHADGDKLFLLHSRDKCVTWSVHLLPPLRHARLEFRDGHNTMTDPPAVLIYKGNELGVILPRRAKDGSLTLNQSVTVSEDSLLVPNHSGGGNSVITVGGRVFVVFPSQSALPNDNGSPQYVTALSRETGEILVAPTLLGSVGVSGPDPHYMPAITADSRGYLHVVLGSHNDSLYYLKSAAPLDASRWSTPKPIGKQRIPTDGGHTYPALLCDAQDRLHVVTRWAGDGYYFRLAYLRGDADTKRWEPQRVLVQPFRNMYSNWYHHLSMDREGRLFLNYRYYANQLNDDQLRAYRQKWPNDGLPPPGSVSKSWQPQVKPHDPAMLFSDDGGTTWRLATTDDLLGR
ncbi:MAG: BNR-4 repeat-containing protein [Phycisphaerales bacterium]